MADESRWTRCESSIYSQDYRRDDGWQLFFDARAMPPAWVILTPRGERPTKDGLHNSELGVGDFVEAQKQADKVIGDLGLRSVHPSQLM